MLNLCKVAFRFSSAPETLVDQTIEETVNKNTETPGGINWFSLKPGAASKYYLTAEYSVQDHILERAETRDWSRRFQAASSRSPKVPHKERQGRCRVLTENNWLKPMCPGEEILNLSAYPLVLWPQHMLPIIFWELIK